MTAKSPSRPRGLLGPCAWERACTVLRGDRRRNATVLPGRVLANDFRSRPRQLTVVVKAVQALHYRIRDPFGTASAVAGS